MLSKRLIWLLYLSPDPEPYIPKSNDPSELKSAEVFNKINDIRMLHRRHHFPYFRERYLRDGKVTLEEIETIRKSGQIPEKDN